MARWFTKRWVWAAALGASVSAGLATGRADGPPKVGAVISLNIDGKGDRQFKVVKNDKQPDGTYLSELKDVKSGETITLVDKTADAVPAGGKAPELPPDPPKAKPRSSDPLVPPAPAAMPDTPKPTDTKRPVLGRVFGDKDKPAAAEMPAEPAKKPGLFGRMFGSKKPAGPSMPAASAAAPAVKPSTSEPPRVIPTPPGGVTARPDLPPFPVTSPPSSTNEPPRVMPARPVTPPAAAPAVPAPLPVPMPPSVPAFPTPSIPTPLPATIPSPLPAPPGLPPIPVPPGGTSMAAPIQVVVPVGFVPAGVAFDREVQPFVIALQAMEAPSARMTAAKGLADGRHASSEGVKGVLFQAARMDPCGEVRAACIDHLCKLGYYNPHFLGHIQVACEDTNPFVRDAAKAACAKMIRK